MNKTQPDQIIERETHEHKISTTQTFVYGWGNDKEGQLGLGVYSYSSNYTAPRYFKYNVNILRISCGFEHSVMLSETGLAYVTGSNKFGQLGLVGS